MATIPQSAAALADAEAHVRRLRLDAERIEAEARKLTAEATRLNAEEYKLAAEGRKLDRDKMLSPWLLLAQGLLAGAALMGASVALVKFLIEH